MTDVTTPRARDESPSTGHEKAPAPAGSRGAVRSWVLTALVAAPGLLVLCASRIGPGISPDSVAYTWAARSFSHSGVLTFGGAPLTLFPPGLPLLLGLLQRAGVDVQTGAVALNVMSVVVTVLLTYLLASETLRSRNLGLAAAALVGLSEATVTVYSMLWTEPLFSVLVLFVLLLLSRAVRRTRIAAWEMAAVAAAASLATTVRFVGIDLVPVIAVGVLLAERGRGKVRATALGALVAVLSCAGFAAVVLRNLSLGHSAMGARDGGTEAPRALLTESVETLGRLVVASPGPALLVGSLVAVLLGFGAIGSVWTRRHDLTVVTAFVVVYWVSIWYSESTTIMDQVSERLATPVFAPMVVLALYAVSALLAVVAGSRRISLALQAALFVGLLLLLAASSFDAAHYAWRAAHEGVGYNETAVLRSPLGRAIAVLPRSVGLAATDPFEAYWRSGRVGVVVQIPRRDHWYPARLTARAMSDLKSSVASGKVSRLAFFRKDTTALRPRAIRRAGIELRLIGRYRDGRLYAATLVTR